MQLPDDKKIRLMYRVEPGCLGPQGADHIEDFCRYANKHIKSPYYGQFLFLPRFDKQKDERQYSVKSRNLSRVQAKAYLNHFEIDIDTFEEQLDELLTKAIDLYFKR
ncbi:hypothetical protein PESP_b0191 [Pseudoalteromonas espejiana DSM 9414]|uniref:Orphan protein n=1 Tax=Pseudoalteromonas espejiana TaxID=28107 RepID=A0A510XVF9_9GAMM|nr:hypothetical protein [Pseudoalteromonas espejiana]ASM51801.1 hypothetical protein PESP_b0191 [Pseudoalteromonas espejiana DSM 9414]GEK55025.1 hypothetical protein PES01_18700 [Pseudoalteromonas espejiana]